MNNTCKTRRKSNPRQNANPLLAATFLYVLPTYIKGQQKPFQEDDLYETVRDLQSERLGNKVEILWDLASGVEKKPSLVKVLISAFGFEYITSGIILAILELVVKPAQAVFLGRLLLFYMPIVDVNTHTTQEEARWYAGGIVFFSFLRITLFHPLIVHTQLIGLKAKIACCALIYRKTLKLNNAAFSKTNIGQMINLLSNDVIIFTKCALMLNHLWVGPLQCLVVTCLMYHYVGVSSIFGVLLLILFLPAYYWLGNLASKYRSKAAMRTDARVCYMNEVILGIEIIKMHAWEKLTTSLMLSLRNLEMKYIRLCTYVKAAYMSCDIVVIPIILWVTIVVYVCHNTIRADTVFTLILYYNSLRLSIGKFFPQALSYRAEALVSARRINEFLLNTEIQLENAESTTDPIAIRISEGNAKWKEDLTLKDINLTVNPGELVAIVGQVGCGKSSLLNVLLKELNLFSGKLYINGEISYASQDAWLFRGSVRDNILFGEKMDEVRYKEVVRVCALECDFNSLPYGDLTMVGGRGASLSGGQKARINLARAVYRDSDIYLLDDPLASVDARVAKQIFEECIKGYLKGKTIMLVTHQIKFLTDVDRLIVLENGAIISQGSMDEKAALDYSKGIDDFDVEELGSRKLAHKVQNVTKEQKSEGSVSKSVYRRYIASCGFLSFLNVAVLFILTQALISGGSYFLAYWVNIAQTKAPSPEQSNSSNVSQILEYNEDTKNMHIFTYSIITIACTVIVCIRSYAFCSMLLKSSQTLHNNMFKNVIGGTMHFFNTNPQGRIINRFSQDMGTVDAVLPPVAIDTIQLLVSAFASVTLIAIVNYWLLIPTVVIGSLCYGLRAFCIPTMRNVKRLEGVTRSPVFEHLSSSLQGLSTIRAFQAEAILKEEFDAHQDLHSGSYHLFLSTSQGFGYFLDCICAIYLAAVTFSFVISGSDILGGNVGLAITECLTVTSILQWAMQQTAEFENNMTCVERILEYESIAQEEITGEEVQLWPKDGEILFRNVSLQYLPDAPPTLKNINFKVAPTEKIGIIGRTGAGKTSIVNALLRLSPMSGEILIDAVDTKSISLQALRSKISVIPQDPTLFSGTLRQNLDPFQEYDDSALWNVLEEVELKKLFTSLPEGLSHVINQGGTNVSVGQRQLICLARAILRNNKILIMDEATANVDLETDSLIQRTIRNKFETCTVLTIAHRLETVMDSDKVLVMNAGEVVEFDKPSVLLNNVNGYFYKMYQRFNKHQHST
ncbi:probable multidrug resistance-associated protein lethal(2)03659 isoform X2 [Photinus pyralis]|nr:probable multidrug resistance-associated protein lethal(2)03659 isoform X2 [Photinus pyralis]